jgi:putative OPT family oligopeptide transporter
LAHESSLEKTSPPPQEFKPYIAPETEIPEFTPKAIIFGSLFGIIFGASTVYLALKAGLTVSASIPIAVLSISVLRLFGRATILENNIVQTIGSAGESVAAGVAFTIPALLFLSESARGEAYFQYMQIMILAAVGGVLGVLFMVPLRRSLIVAEHGNLPYPEGTACADVLIAGEKGGPMAGFVFGGVAISVLYKVMNSVLAFWKEAIAFTTGNARTVTETSSAVAQTAAKNFPNGSVAAEISPEYLGVGYILGPRVGGIMVSGSVIAWLALIPLLTILGLSDEKVDGQLRVLGFSESRIDTWRATDDPERYYRGYVRLIGAGAVTMAGIITLIRTIPTIVKSIRGSVASMRGAAGVGGVLRTERDISIAVVGIGSLALAGVLAVLPVLPGTLAGKLLMAVLMLVFGFLFVTVSSRIVGIIGSSSNPISAMTIATLLGTCVVFISMGMSGPSFQPVALSVGAIVCIAAANAGATSQDLKTGFLVGATPVRQQIGLVIGVLVSTFVIGLTIKGLDTAYATESEPHGIGSKFPAPQATLMATIIKGVMSGDLDWSLLLVGAGLSLTVYLCGVSPLAWAVGLYLPISTTFPIFVGGMLRVIAERLSGHKEETEISPGMLFATGLVAGGTLTGVLSAGLKAWPFGDSDVLTKLQHVGEEFQKTITFNHDLFALIFYAILAVILVVIALKKMPGPPEGNKAA